MNNLCTFKGLHRVSALDEMLASQVNLRIEHECIGDSSKILLRENKF